MEEITICGTLHDLARLSTARVETDLRIRQRMVGVLDRTVAQGYRWSLSSIAHINVRLASTEFPIYWNAVPVLL